MGQICSGIKEWFTGRPRTNQENQQHIPATMKRDNRGRYHPINETANDVNTRTRSHDVRKSTEEESTSKTVETKRPKLAQDANKIRLLNEKCGKYEEQINEKNLEFYDLKQKSESMKRKCEEIVDLAKSVKQVVYSEYNPGTFFELLKDPVGTKLPPDDAFNRIGQNTQSVISKMYPQVVCYYAETGRFDQDLQASLIVLKGGVDSN
jgi:hypothetical protein